MEDARVLMLNSLWHNSRVMNNDLEMLFYVACSTRELALKTLDLMTRVQPHTVGDRDGIPDELVVEMNHSPITNLWKYADLLKKDHALLSVELVVDAPDWSEYLDALVTDKVVRHTTVYSGAE